MNYSTFDKTTGRLTSSVTVPDNYTIPPSSDYVIEGVYNGHRHYLDLNTMTVKDAGFNPTPFHYLSGMDGWVLDRNAAESRTRASRDTLLTDSDWVELPSAKTRLSDTKLVEWEEYRQALRDIPEQVGFPVDVEWPTKP